MKQVSIVGVPSSAASYAAGQDLAPAALRDAGLVEALAESGLTVNDAGDLPHQVWRPDRDHPLAQNLDQVVESLVTLAHRLEPLLRRSDLVLVLGGNSPLPSASSRPCIRLTTHRRCSCTSTGTTT